MTQPTDAGAQQQLSQTMIDLRDVRFAFPNSDFTLHVPSLQVDAGSTVAIVGPSGSGKTTLLNLIAGILVPTSGKLTTHGTDVGGLSPAARRRFRLQTIGLVFQEFELLEHLQVFDNILLPSRLTPEIRVDASLRERVGALAEELGIADKLARYVRKLSQGERQRVALCRALLLEPPLLLCDEPTGALDIATGKVVLEALNEINRRIHTTLILITHNAAIADLADRVIQMRDGHVHEITTNTCPKPVDELSW